MNPLYSRLIILQSLPFNHGMADTFLLTPKQHSLLHRLYMSHIYPEECEAAATTRGIITSVFSPGSQFRWLRNVMNRFFDVWLMRASSSTFMSPSSVVTTWAPLSFEYGIILYCRRQQGALQVDNNGKITCKIAYDKSCRCRRIIGGYKVGFISFLTLTLCHIKNGLLGAPTIDFLLSAPHPWRHGGWYEKLPIRETR